MGLLALICFIIGLISLACFSNFVFNKIKSRIKKNEYEFKVEFPFDYYKKKPLVFLVSGLLIILLTLFTFSPSIMSLFFSNNLRYKPEGTYCYYVVDKSGKAYPAKIEKTSETMDSGEDYFGNPTSDTHIYVMLLELFANNESYYFDDPQEINTDSFTSITYYDVVETDDGGEEEIEKEFILKLTNDVAYCPSFGKGTTKIDYLELIFEILVIISEISMYFITIVACRKENE